IGDGNGSPTPQGDALLATPDAFTATDLPRTPETFTFQLTNDGARGQPVSPIVRTLGPTTSSASYTVQLSPLSDSTFVDAFGIARAYVEQDFTVPAGAQRLDAAIAWNVI